MIHVQNLIQLHYGGNLGPEDDTCYNGEEENVIKIEDIDKDYGTPDSDGLCALYALKSGYSISCDLLC
ncbi:hypothetical protein BDA99DRAFT_508645 [Phascolomyces articulosus]|uniref:Uncharacterized protein n=1 Tax=Phascolomyces articulosus TaxID=60185 RepID=A0AAD5K199_9FUNG|nr:hypothetical protein BDA99DRAFT_508645 [Phascolomyces articulosus]